MEAQNWGDSQVCLVGLKVMLGHQYCGISTRPCPCTHEDSCKYGSVCICLYHPQTQGNTMLPKSSLREGLKWCSAITIPQGPCYGGFTSAKDLYQVCATPGSNQCDHIPLNIVHPTKQGSLQLGMQSFYILRVVEVVLCRCHTPRPMSWQIGIYYGSIPTLYNSRKKSMCPYHPRDRSSNQARVTVAWYATILYSEGD